MPERREIHPFRYTNDYSPRPTAAHWTALRRCVLDIVGRANPRAAPEPAATGTAGQSETVTRGRNHGRARCGPRRRQHEEQSAVVRARWTGARDAHGT